MNFPYRNRLPVTCLVIAWWFTIFVASAQVDFQLPLLSETGSSVFSRPSTMPSNKFFIGIPALSGVNVSFTNDGLSYLDAHFLTDTGAVIDLDVLISSLHKRNTISFQSSFDILSAGALFGKLYVDVNMSHKANMLFRYPRELVDLFYQGNGAFIGTTVDMSKLGLSASHYWEFGVGVTGQINEELSTGIRLKRLYGIDNVSTRLQTLRANTVPGDYELQLSSDLVVNTSTIFSSSGGLDSLRDRTGGMKEYLFNPENTGWAVSFGAGYSFDDYSKLTFDVLDLGFIRWGYNPVNYRLDNGYYSFSGIAIDDYLVSNVDSNDVLAAYVDSIKSVFDISESKEAYKEYLPTSIMFNFEHVFTKNTTGFLSVRATHFKNELIPLFGLMVRHRMGKHFAFSGSLSHQYGNYFSLGGGVVAQFGLFNLFLVSDNIYGTIVPLSGNRTNISFGMSISRSTWGVKSR